MEELLPLYERELSTLRRYVREFATRNPRLAARLGISGDRSDDIQVERMLESFALLAANAGARIEDEYPEFTTALLELLYPQYLRTLPPCSIAQFATDGMASPLTEPVTVERGTALEARAGEWRFRTVYDVTVAPLRLAFARFSQSALAPSSARLPERTTGIVSIGFAPTADGGFRSPPRLRLHLHGEPMLVPALLDTLLMRASAAFVEVDGAGRWKALPSVPLAPAGFAPADALYDQGTSSLATFRLLLEHFAFPDKFHFVDLDFARVLREAGACRTLTLHLAITGLPSDSPAARALEPLEARNLRLFCTPIINLFEREAQPIPVQPGISRYPVIPQTPRIRETEVHSIDAVYAVTQKGGVKTAVEIPPYYSLRHDESSRPGAVFWIADHDRWTEQQQPGYEAGLRCVGIDAQPAVPPGDQLEVRLTCNNRADTAPFATNAANGGQGGDLFSEDTSFAATISMLRAPTRGGRPSQRNGALWRLLSQLTPNHLSLDVAGLRAMLQQHSDAASTTGARRIGGIVALDYRPSMKWMPVKPLPTFVRGIEVVLSIDEQAFAGTSLHSFIAVMDLFFAPYAHRNSFVQLVVKSAATGAEIVRREPRQGGTPLL